MGDRRGLRLADLMLGVVLSGAALWVLTHPWNKADPRILASAIGQPWAKNDPSVWLCPAAVLTASFALFTVFLGSKVAMGRRRTFLEGAALGGWLFFLLTLAPNVDPRLTSGFLPSRWCNEGADALTKYVMGIPQSDFALG
jgi:hypothetical protein